MLIRHLKKVVHTGDLQIKIKPIGEQVSFFLHISACVQQVIEGLVIPRWLLKLAIPRSPLHGRESLGHLGTIHNFLFVLSFFSSSW